MQILDYIQFLFRVSQPYSKRFMVTKHNQINIKKLEIRMLYVYIYCKTAVILDYFICILLRDNKSSKL